MKRILSNVTRLTSRTRLVLSVLLLFAAFFFFWVGIGRPLPTADLAFRLLAAQSAYTPRDGMLVLDDDDLPLTHDVPEGVPPQRRYLSLEGDRLYYGVVTRFHPLSWTGAPDGLWPYSLEERPLSQPILLNIYTRNYSQPMDEPDADGMRRWERGHEGWYALACRDPSVVRIAVTASYRYVVSELNSAGTYESIPVGEAVTGTAECSEAEPGSGIWLVRIVLPEPPRPQGADLDRGYLSVSLTCAAYGASGAEIARIEG